jgi:lipopolysaccharide export system protein LptA
MTTTRLACISAALMIVFALPAQAERADREKPINLEADRISMDDVKKVQVFEGNVILTQGTMQILTNRLVVTQDADGFQKGVATGGANGLARFRQKRDGTGDYIEGEAERIEHNARDEKTEFFTRAWVKSGQDEVRGHYISYDALTENYVVTNGGDTKTATGAPQARVRAIIQPKGKNAPPAEQTGGESSAPKPTTPATPKP